MVMRINKINISQTIPKKQNNTSFYKFDNKSAEIKRKYIPAFSGFFADYIYRRITPDECFSEINRQFKLFPRIKRYLPYDFYRKFDYENSKAHLDNLRYLNERKSSFNDGDMFSEGYFYSKDGLEATNTLIKYYGNNTDAKDIELAASFLKLEDILRAKRQKIYENVPYTDYDHIYMIKDILSLSEEEYSRLLKSGLLKKEIDYASCSHDINKFFENYKNTSNYKIINADVYKYLEKGIINFSKGDKKEILKLINKLTSLKNQSLFHSIVSKAVIEDEHLNLNFLADNLDNTIEKLKEKKCYKNSQIKYVLENVFHKLNDENLSTFYELIDLKDMNISTLQDCTGYLCSKENIANMQSIIRDIKLGLKKIIDIPPFKYAKLNPRIEYKRNYKIQEFDKDFSLDKALELTQNGEVFGLGDDAYINNNSKAEKLNLDKETYKKLFPEFETLCIKQSENIKDCFLLTSGLFSFWKNPKAKAKLLNMFSLRGNDIVVTIPKFKNYPIVFKNKKVNMNAYHADTSLGNIMLEHAYAMIRYKILYGADGLAIPAENYEQLALESIPGGRESFVFNEFLDSNEAVEVTNNLQAYKNDKDNILFYEVITPELLDDLADDENAMLCCASDCSNEDWGIIERHSYAIERIDKKNKTVTIVNPYNTLYMAVLSYDDFIKYFPDISGIDV